MNEDILDTEWLEDYASKHNIYDLNSEDILKLFDKSYIIEFIVNAFGITEKEFDKIRKNKKITNMHLERSIRDIYSILYYIDNQDRYISDKIRNYIINELILVFSSVYPNKEFYKRELTNINFDIDEVEDEIIKREIDVNYRLKNLDFIIKSIDREIDKLIKQEKDKLIYHNRKLYQKLLDDKKNGYKFSKEDLTYDILYQLSVIENISDHLIGDIFNLTKQQVRYIRVKNGLNNKFNTKIKDNPEALMYYMEEKGLKDEKISNHEYKEAIDYFLKNLDNKEVIYEDIYEDIDEITIEVDNKKMTYNVSFSNSDYFIEEPTRRNKRKGSKINQKKLMKIKFYQVK